MHLGFKKVATVQIKIYLIRTLSGIVAMWTWFYAVTLIPIGEQTALSFLAPLFTTVGAAFLLRETVRARRWAAIIIGFIGALIIIQPGIIKINLASIASLGAGISYAFYVISTRKLSSFDNPYLTLIFTGVFGAIIISVIIY